MGFLDDSLFLQILQVTATITTLAMFLSGIAICLDIRRRGTTKEINSFPLVMGFIGSAFWLRYGFLVGELAIIVVNAIGSSLMFCYLLFYIWYSSPRLFITLLVCLDLFTLLVMCVVVHLHSTSHFDTTKMVLGIVCLVFNILNFGAPLAGLWVVFKQRSCDTLPLPLIVANFFVSSQWFLFGIFKHDTYITIPNAIGIVLALIQLSLFLFFPRAKGKTAPLGRCFPCLRRVDDEEDNMSTRTDTTSASFGDKEKKPVRDDKNLLVSMPIKKNSALQVVKES